MAAGKEVALCVEVGGRSGAPPWENASCRRRAGVLLDISGCEASDKFVDLDEQSKYFLQSRLYKTVSNGVPVDVPLDQIYYLSNQVELEPSGWHAKA